MEAKASQRVAEARRGAELEALMQEAQALERQLKLDVEATELAEIRRGMAADTKRRNAEEVGFGKLPKMAVERAEIDVIQAEAKNLEARATLFLRWSQFISVAGEDPVLANLPDRHVRKEK
jgi:hypothetical protein